MTAFRYPIDLAEQLDAEWPTDLPADPLASHRAPLLELAYQASMARDEERPVRLRILLSRPDDLPDGSSEALHVLRFDSARPCDIDELRRIAAAAPFETALVCVAPNEAGELWIWGIAWSGAQWLAPTWGGRGRGRFLVPRTVIHVGAPGRLAVHAGDRFVAALERGALVTLATDVFSSTWMPALFAEVRAELVDQHDRDRGPASAALDESVIRSISQHMLRRALWLMRAAHHGGAILFVEAGDAERLLAGPLRAKYRFVEGEARERYRTLLRRLTGELAHAHARTWTVTARDFLESPGELAGLEAAIFEISRLIASLSAVDGAVLMSKRFEIVGFGVEILSGDAAPARIRRALDTEGDRCVDDREESVGTRHRAAYRFVQAHPRGLAIVVSQDGTVRFVARRHGEITYFEQHLAG